MIVEGLGLAPEFPNLAFGGAGNYKLRVHARGRPQGQADAALTLDEPPIEEHLIQIWKVSHPDGDFILKTTDVVGVFK